MAQFANENRYPTPTRRHLRGYALDPSLSQSLRTAAVSEITFKVPWEKLDPGPRGEYVEVIDHDPSVKCFYEPVDLDDPFLLAQDGLTPAEGIPQFHQQMVYAVASTTIENFERALGRKALWSPGPPPDGKSPENDSHFVRRLRIYPHALRDANAYYSPAKKALLFGYFSAPENDRANHVPGGTVFTCLSHDIVAHETAHALLDGMYRRLLEASNPDMLAFHEAFADVVALFQHFTFPEILRHEIANTRGDLQTQENVLGKLASQFGRATGLRGALRDAIGKFDKVTGKWTPTRPDPADLDHAEEPHARGAILVAAIFDAFLRIYADRTSDLLRIYTGGTGVLSAGAIHPDLVSRLADEASKSADHVLTMCVRALDYCPPVDLSFGEYLRALLTADIDLHAADPRNYRIAFVEAFRQRGIYPRDVRALSVDNLRWRRVDEDELHPSAAILKRLKGLKEYAHRQLYALDRKKLFQEERSARVRIREVLRDHFENASEAESDARFFGVDHTRPVEVHATHFAVRQDPNNHPRFQLIVQITQRDRSEDEDNARALRFYGGSTVIIDVKNARIDYCIRKSVTSATRRARQLAYRKSSRGTALSEAYFGLRTPGDAAEPFAFLHRGY